MSEKKIALITGANRGIGFETARQLGQQGITVLLGARDAEKGKAAAETLRAEGIDAEFVRLDVDDAATRAAARKQIEEKYGRLDILINNAGVMLDERENGAIQPPSRTSAEVFRRTFETNFFNVVALTQEFLPLVKKAAAGRIVFLSSILGSLALHADPASPIYDFKVPAYDISKTALNGYVVHLAHELRETPVKVNAAHPGSVLTEMNAYGELTVEEGAKTSVDLATLSPRGYNGKLIHLGQELPW
ncbi:MAG: SDR family oxidoreductase [Acidobacteria bacterium]|nr:SDR family oxidoreductase [Acidobacteriota bacterium]